MPEESEAVVIMRSQANEPAKKDGIKDMLSHMNDEYRKANISEETYKELKAKYGKDDLISEETYKELKAKYGNEGTLTEAVKEEPAIKEDVKEEASPAEAVKEDTVKEEPAPTEQVAEAVQEVKKEKKRFGFLSFRKKKPKQDEEKPPEEALTDEPQKEDVSQPEEEHPKDEEKPPEEALTDEPQKEDEPKPAEEKKEEKPKEEKHEEEKKEKAPEEELTEEEKLIQKASMYVTPEGRPTGLAGGEATETEAKPLTQDNVSMEIEKLKVMIDTFRETKKATDETIQTLFESTGEIRSMVFQADASLRETTSKLEKIEDEISELSPQKITKKFSEINATQENNLMTFEKFERKTEDMAKNINKALDMLKEIGGIENLAQLNLDIQKKVSEINEVYKYIERLAAKTEKAYVDLNKALNDFIIYKNKQDNLDDVSKDILKAMDAQNVKFEAYATKKDLESMKQDVILVQDQIGELDKALPLLKTKIPENITAMKSKKEDIHIFLRSLEEQMKAGKISAYDYEDIKQKNMKKLSEIDDELKKEWGGFLSAINAPQAAPVTAEPQQQPVKEAAKTKEAAPVTAEPQPAKEESRLIEQGRQLLSDLGVVSNSEEPVRRRRKRRKKRKHRHTTKRKTLHRKKASKPRHYRKKIIHKHRIPKPVKEKPEKKTAQPKAHVKKEEKKTIGETAEPKEMDKKLMDVPQERVFWVKNGAVIKNLKELEESLRSMDAATFNHHANAEKNDFSNWVNDVIGDQKLADELKAAKDSKASASVVNKRIDKLSR